MVRVIISRVPIILLTLVIFVVVVAVVTSSVRASRASKSILFVYIVKPISSQKILPETPQRSLHLVKIDKDNFIKVKACRGEFEPASFVLRSNTDLKNISILPSDLRSLNGKVIHKSEVDLRIVKCWYQAGRQVWEINKRILVPELLLKDDSLVKVDQTKKKNFIRVTKSGKSEYIDISSTHFDFPSGAEIYDSKSLLPFDLQANTNKQIWVTLHVPEKAESGVYTGNITIKVGNVLQKSIDLELTVLPFDLKSSSISYGLYYRGMLQEDPVDEIGSDKKSERQYIDELQNMKNHGVLYPTLRQGYGKLLGTALSLRKDVGLPTDKVFSLGISTQGVEGLDKLIRLRSSIKRWKSILTQYGYKDLFVYGKDEAKGDALHRQRPAWEMTHETGAKVFAACHEGAVNLVGDLLDVAVLAGEFKPEEVDKWHKLGKKVYIYSNPQVGIEDPEIYRRQYGILLKCKGYDGVLNYAYQHSMDHIWNDFDHNKWRDHVFAYPTSDGVIDTVQWEGFREAVDDVRYLTTLDAISNRSSSEFLSTCETIAVDDNLELLRERLIDRILSKGNATN